MLEIIKNDFKKYGFDGLNHGQLEWLFEQVEKVEKLETQVKELNREIGRYSNQIDNLISDFSVSVTYLKKLKAEMLNA